MICPRWPRRFDSPFTAPNRKRVVPNGVIRQRLIIEGTGCKAVVTIQRVYEFFEQLTYELDMRILVPPIVIQVPFPNPAPIMATDDCGISGQMIWMESGASLHHWENEQFVAVDIFSCKPYSVARAIRLFEIFFRPEEIQTAQPEPK